MKRSVQHEGTVSARAPHPHAKTELAARAHAQTCSSQRPSRPLPRHTKKHGLQGEGTPVTFRFGESAPVLKSLGAS